MDTFGRSLADYNRRVWLELNGQTADPSGQLIDNWLAQFKRWAMMVPRSGGGRERKLWDQLQPEIDYLIRVPFDSVTSTITAALWRVNLGGTGIIGGALTGGQRFNIVSAVDVEMRRVEIEMQCVEVRRIGSTD